MTTAQDARNRMKQLEAEINYWTHEVELNKKPASLIQISIFDGERQALDDYLKGELLQSSEIDRHIEESVDVYCRYRDALIKQYGDSFDDQTLFEMKLQTDGGLPYEAIDAMREASYYQSYQTTSEALKGGVTNA